MRCAKLLLLLPLAGCMTAPALPPYDLARACPAPEAEITTNADLARYALALKSALAECDDDKAVLRLWIESTKESNAR